MAQKYQFDEFTLDESCYRLQRGERVMRLEKRPMELLILLVQRDGELVSREEIAERLWGKNVFLDVDHSINTAVRKVRQALRDDPEKPRFVETVVGKGYRFAAPVVCRNGGSNSQATDSSLVVREPAYEPPLELPPLETVQADTEPVRAALPVEKSIQAPARQWWRLVFGVITAAFVSATFSWWFRPTGAPMVTAITQLTDDGQPKILPLLTDGSRIYFGEGTYPSFRIAQVAIGGGPIGDIPTTLPVPHIIGLAPKGSALLVHSSRDPLSPNAPLWQLPLPAGSPIPLSNIQAADGSYTPDGHVLFAQNGDLFIAEGDGSAPRKLVSGMPGPINEPSMSPDGTRITFTVYAALTAQTISGVTLPAIFEANADGSGVHALMDSLGGGWICCGAWTPDGKYLIVSKGHNRIVNVWLIPLKPGRFGRSLAAVQLTNGPLAYGGAKITPDGKQILAFGMKERGELVRYDLATGQFVPFLSGISALDPTFSSDGTWVAYTSLPDGSLWRSRSNGTERLQLTYPPDQVIDPFISPDGKQVVYQTANGSGSYVISMDGGAPKKVVDFNVSPPNWSPDSNRLVFNDYRGGYVHAKMNVLDLRTGHISVLPGDQLGPQWIGPHKLIGATSDLKGFQIFDLATQKWSDVPGPRDAQVVLWAHSPDFKYFYYTTGDQNRKVIRVRMADLQSEAVTSLKEFPLAHSADGGETITIAPDASPIFTRELGTQEIYALGVKWP
jgi:DNA-binding winged helix-turn-helix (wHTH) protein/WD40 repeat protein